MLKVLLITTVKIGYDGLTNHIFSYIKSMDKSDIQIDLVSARGIDEQIEPQLEKVGFHQVYRLEYRDTNQFKYSKDLIKILKRNMYDIMHAHGNSATLAIEMLAGKISGCKVRIAHSHTTSCKHKFLNFCLKPTFNLCYTHGFACGKSAGKWLFGEKDFTILKNGKEIEKYKFNAEIRQKYRRILNLNDNNVAIGNVAAFVNMKNHKFMISFYCDLIKKDDRYKMYLFGIDGEALVEVKAQIRSLGMENRIYYMGTKDNIQDYMQAMDIMILPSLYEGFPVSVIEWQMGGLPCILSETITRDCNILGNIKYLPINQGTKPWVKEILNTDYNIENREINNINKIFTKAGFNIKLNASKLKQIYINISME